MKSEHFIGAMLGNRCFSMLGEGKQWRKVIVLNEVVIKAVKES